MTAIAYTMVAYGCHSAGWSFWRAMCWPVACGRLIVRAIKGG